MLHEASPLPLLALERDGALYDVAELDHAFGTPYDPDVFAGAADFHTRVVALGGAGLADLDERLRRGERPSAARLIPGTFAWLPPCDVDRVLHVQLAAHDAPSARPSFRFANARALLGHDEPIPFPADEARPTARIAIAAVLREDLAAAAEDEVEAAILGYTILNGWLGGDDAARDAEGAQRVAPQLGPVVVTPEEVGDLARLRVQIRVAGQVVAACAAGGWTFSPAAAIAWISRWTPLRAGDVIGLGALRGGAVAAPHGSMVELLVERLGKLCGRPLRAG